MRKNGKKYNTRRTSRIIDFNETLRSSISGKRSDKTAVREERGKTSTLTLIEKINGSTHTQTKKEVN